MRRLDLKGKVSEDVPQPRTNTKTRRTVAGQAEQCTKLEGHIPHHSNGLEEVPQAHSCAAWPGSCAKPRVTKPCECHPGKGMQRHASRLVHEARRTAGTSLHEMWHKVSWRCMAHAWKTGPVRCPEAEAAKSTAVVASWQPGRYAAI